MEFDKFANHIFRHSIKERTFQEPREFEFNTAAQELHEFDFKNATQERHGIGGKFMT